MGTVLGCISLLQEKKAEEEVQLDALQVAVIVVLSFVSVVEWRPPGKGMKEPCPSCRLESYLHMTSIDVYMQYNTFSTTSCGKMLGDVHHEFAKSAPLVLSGKPIKRGLVTQSSLLTCS